MSNTAKRRYLGLPLGRALLDRIRDVGRAYDVMKGGPFDVPWGTINVWARPEDKPSCWDVAMSNGAWGPSAYVGELCWEWADDQPCRPYVEACPYDLREARWQSITRGRLKEGQRGAGARPQPGEELTPAEWASVLDWLEAKARSLFRLAELAPDVVGLRCPLCDWIMPVRRLLNEMVEHVQQAHPEVTIKALVLADPTYLDTDRGRLILENVERFA